MLNKKENAVMKVIYMSAKDKTSLLITPNDIINLCGRDDITVNDVETVMKDLSFDRYFDLVYSDRKGELVYCISLTEKGKGFERDRKMLKRNLVYKLFITVIFAILSFVIGIILRAIF